MVDTWDERNVEHDDRLLSIDARGSATGAEVEWMLDMGYAISATNGRADWMMSQAGERMVRKIKEERAREAAKHPEAPAPEPFGWIKLKDNEYIDTHMFTREAKKAKLWGTLPGHPPMPVYLGSSAADPKSIDDVRAQISEEILRLSMESSLLARSC